MNEAKSFIEILKEHVSSDKAKLPAFNRTGLAIQQEMARPDPDMQVIEKQILRDPAVAGQLLKVANSSFYRGMIEVTTVRNAMVRLGLAEVSNLVTLLTQKQSFTTQDPFIREYMDQLWIHSVACALGSKWIAKECRLPSKMNEAFFAGLLHDIGKAFPAHGHRRPEKKRPTGRKCAPVLYRGGARHAAPESWRAAAQELEPARNLLHRSRASPRRKHGRPGHHPAMVSLANKVLAKTGIGIVHTPDIDLATSPEAIQLDLSEIKVAELELTVEDYVDFVRKWTEYLQNSGRTGLKRTGPVQSSRPLLVSGRGGKSATHPGAPGFLR
jgi:hypothetical protein